MRVNVDSSDGAPATRSGVTPKTLPVPMFHRSPAACPPTPSAAHTDDLATTTPTFHDTLVRSFQCGVCAEHKRIVRSLRRMDDGMECVHQGAGVVGHNEQLVERLIIRDSAQPPGLDQPADDGERTGGQCRGHVGIVRNGRSGGGRGRRRSLVRRRVDIQVVAKPVQVVFQVMNQVSGQVGATKAQLVLVAIAHHHENTKIQTSVVRRKRRKQVVRDQFEKALHGTTADRKVNGEMTPLYRTALRKGKRSVVAQFKPTYTIQY